MQKYQRDAGRLLKLLVYILGRRPDEFGLVPDREGYVRCKDLVKAIGEEDGWRHVRISHIDQLFLTLSDPPLERREGLIRVRDREKLPAQTAAVHPPALLYTCVRKRAYPVVCEKGIRGMGDGRVVLSTGRPMAERIGRRFDRNAVLLTVHAESCQARGVLLFRAGADLFWTGSVIPKGCFSGPPLPEEKPAARKKAVHPEAPPAPGSFILDPFAEKAISRGRKPPGAGRDGYLKGKGRKKNRRKRQPPPWRA
ncbi:MAG: hypothetical protein DSY89_09370 [Deltaproteobacteria bacterium]|nr:MAG: hypothetical protein DSY89_09370 [Deltaproteobacteria bacterium]